MYLNPAQLTDEFRIARAITALFEAAPKEEGPNQAARRVTIKGAVEPATFGEGVTRPTAADTNRAPNFWIVAEATDVKPINVIVDYFPRMSSGIIKHSTFEYPTREFFATTALRPALSEDWESIYQACYHAPLLRVVHRYPENQRTRHKSLFDWIAVYRRDRVNHLLGEIRRIAGPKIGRALSARLKELYMDSIADDLGVLSEESLEVFMRFLSQNPDVVQLPQLVLSAEGYVVAEWIFSEDELTKIVFLPNRVGRFLVFAKDPAQRLAVVDKTGSASLRDLRARLAAAGSTVFDAR